MKIDFTNRIIGKCYLSVSCDKTLWWIRDDEYKYTHFFHIGFIFGKDISGLQIVILWLLVAIAWPIDTAAETR